MALTILLNLHHVLRLYPQLWLNIGKGSESSLNVSGARNDREKANVIETLEAIWQDDCWLP